MEIPANIVVKSLFSIFPWSEWWERSSFPFCTFIPGLTDHKPLDFLSEANRTWKVSSTVQHWAWGFWGCASNFLRWLESMRHHYGSEEWTTRALSLPPGYCSAQSSLLDIIFPPERNQQPPAGLGSASPPGSWEQREREPYSACNLMLMGSQDG